MSGCRGNKLTILTSLVVPSLLVKPVLIGDGGVEGNLADRMSGAREVTVVTTQKFSVITPRMAPRKPEDDPYDCINMQQQPATDKGLVNAEMLAALPHKKEADPPQDTSAVYTFLGLATLPRLSKANPRLHEIPRELVTHIAEFAHRPEYRCYWLGTANSTRGAASKVDVTRHADVVLAMPPMRKGVHYVEIILGCAWCHTKICFEGVGQFFWLEFTEEEIDAPGAEDTWKTMCFKSFDYTMRELVIPASQYGHIEPPRTYCVEWWDQLDERVRVGLLVDMDRGCVTCRINGRHSTPCVRFPTFAGIRWGMAKTGAAPTTTRRHRRSTCNAAPQKAPGPITNTGAAASRSWSETSPTGRGCGGRRAFAFRGALSRVGPRAAGLPTRFSGRRRTR